jgi:hypothetical protein
MKTILLTFLAIIVFNLESVYAQFHDYTVKFGFHGNLLFPRTEFDSDSYNLSLMGRGFIKAELSSIFEIELGTGIGRLNGKDFDNSNWSTDLYPLDLIFLLSPFHSEITSIFFYSGISILRWKAVKLPESVSPKPTKKFGWDPSLPLGAGIELILNEEILLDIRGGYNFVYSDDLNYFNSSSKKDGFFNIGIGLTFVMGGSMTDDDDDGLVKKYEIEIGSNPILWDSDGDNLSDGEEILIYKTDPLKIDTDLDSINDFDEINIYKTDPNSADTDGDSINDDKEIYEYKSDPNLKDSDSDGLSDGYELNIYNTNPLKIDSDDDNLTDADEIKRFNTDPNLKDSDRDTIDDDIEIISENTDPLDRNSLKKITDLSSNQYNLADGPIIMEGIIFETNSTVLKHES